jgi:DNA-binding NarL/FixJ family response regulator
VDDFEPWRHFVRSSLNDLPELQIVDEACDGLEAVQKARELQPDLILLDISLPSLNGIDAARQISVLSPASKILFVSMTNDPETVEAALSDGAMGFVHKSNGSHALLAAIRAIVRGDRFVSRRVRLS